MKIIDIENWNRKTHYFFFKDYEIPHLSVTLEFTVTKLVEYLKENKKISNKSPNFFEATLYLIMKSLNEVEAYRYRIRNGKPVLHDDCGAGFTFMKKPPHYCNCYVKFNENFTSFLENLREITSNDETLMNPKNMEDDVFFMSFAPWGKFTSITNPYKVVKDDTIPRIVWSNAYNENGEERISLSLQVHHSFVDGYHIGQFSKKFKANIAKFIKK